MSSPEEEPTPHPLENPKALLAILDEAQDLIALVDDHGVYKFINDAVTRALGYEPATLLDDDALEYLHPVDRDRVTEAFRSLDCQDPADTLTIEYRHQHADDTWIWLESRVLKGAIPGFEGYVVSARNVSERKQVEKRERETESQLRQLAANTDDVLWMFSADWDELLFVNEAYENIWGQSIEALFEDPTAFLDGIHPDDRPRVETAMQRVSQGESFDMEYRVNTEKEYRRWVWVKAKPVIKDGSVTRIVGFSRDVTDYHRQERQLRVMDNLLRHNLRNDMNIILGHAELAKQQVKSAVADSMDTILSTGEKLLATAEKEREIIDVLIRIDEPTRFDLATLVQDVIGEFQTAYPAAEVDVTTPASAEVEALPEIRRTIHELLENAVEHTDGTASIEVAIKKTNDHVDLAVKDNAPPIPDNEFEPLLGQTEPDEQYHTTGLGLWLVYWVVDLSDGDLKIQSPPDGGNIITITLPRAP